MGKLMICDPCKDAADKQEYSLRADVDPHLYCGPAIKHTGCTGCPCKHVDVGDTRIIKKIDPEKNKA